MGRSWGKRGGGAAGPLVGPAGVGSGAGMMGGGGMSEPQQQQLNVADEAIVTRGNVAAIKERTEAIRKEQRLARREVKASLSMGEPVVGADHRPVHQGLPCGQAQRDV